jgi:hypothetical protein
MTSIVGIHCTNGVVIGTDSAATFAGARGIHIIEQPTEKIDVIQRKIIVACTGSVGFGQRFNAIVHQGWKKKIFQKDPIDVGKHLSRELIEDLLSTRIQVGGDVGLGFGSLIAFPNGHTPHLCEFDVKTFQPEFKDRRIWYGSMGSSQHITDPFLAFMREVFWGDELPNVYDGIFAVTWALDHAIRYNPGGVNSPIRIAVLEPTKKGQLEARILEDEELGEHHQNIAAAKDVLKDFRQLHRVADQENIPDVPKP